MLKFDIASSDGSGIYTVTVEGAPGMVRMSCTCQAGVNGQQCKHRLSLLAQDDSSIRSGNANDLDVLAEWFPGSALERSLKAYQEAEDACEAAKKVLAKAKKDVAKVMRTG